MAHTDAGTDTLLVSITRCPVAERCLAGELLPCWAVVGSQHAALPDSFHVPEPWSGHIQNAAVLIVSSNPSIDPAEAYPVGDWEDARRVDFFAGRFDRRAVPWVDRKMRLLLATAPPAHRDNETRFWFAARARASELLERPAEPGADFALTEVVHCKSPAEIGVAAAYSTCRRRAVHEFVANWQHVGPLVVRGPPRPAGANSLPAVPRKPALGIPPLDPPSTLCGGQPAISPCLPRTGAAHVLLRLYAKWISGPPDEAKPCTLKPPSPAIRNDRPGGVLRSVPDSAGPGRAAITAHEPVIIFGTYLAQAAAHAHSAPRATACDTISPRPRTRWSGAISGGGSRCPARTSASRADGSRHRSPSAAGRSPVPGGGQVKVPTPRG